MTFFAVHQTSFPVVFGRVATFAFPNNHFLESFHRGTVGVFILLCAFTFSVGDTVSIIDFLLIYLHRSHISANNYICLPLFVAVVI